MDWQLSTYITQLNDDPNFTLTHNPLDVCQLDQHDLHNALNSA